MRDFTKGGVHETSEQEPDPVTEAIRSGVERKTGIEGLKLGLAKLSGDVPMGVDAPTKGLRKTIGGGWELLHLLKYGFLSAFLLLAGGLFLWAGTHEKIDLKLLGVAAILLVLGLISGRWAVRAGRNLRAITKA